MAKRVLRYIKQTKFYCMVLTKNDLNECRLLSGFSDANFGVENRGLSR